MPKLVCNDMALNSVFSFYPVLQGRQLTAKPIDQSQMLANDPH